MPQNENVRPPTARPVGGVKPQNKFFDLQPKYIGNYRIISTIGKGGMGEIYKAEQVQAKLRRYVALKVLPPQFLHNDELYQRFVIEAKAIMRLNHQNIVNIYEYGEDNGYHFIAMQYIDGMDLGCYIANTRNMDIPEIINFAKQICRGLLYAHSHGVVHRDIKPQNLLLDKDNIIHITDFGIAKVTSEPGPTQTGSTVGTPEYMSPEQAQGKDIDKQSDIYSLGIVMYEMLTGKPPFTANNSMAVAYKQVHEHPSPPSLKRKSTPKQLELIILKALKKEKHERYATVEDMMNHLDKVDITERANPKTVVINQTKPGKKSKDEDRRITDRRNGDRRNGSRRAFEGAHHPVFSGTYWKMMVKTQWPSLLAIAALGAAVVLVALRGWPNFS